MYLNISLLWGKNIHKNVVLAFLIVFTLVLIPSTMTTQGELNFNNKKIVEAVIRWLSAQQFLKFQKISVIHH